MLSKNKIKWIHSLELKKNRDEEGLFLAEGPKIVSELLSSSIKCIALYAVEEWFNKNTGLIKYFPSETEMISDNELKKISFLKAPQEVIAIAKIPEYGLNVKEIKSELILALDTVQDPGNLGTIIRIADWFGITNILCSNDTADAFNPKVVQASMGAILRVKIQYCELKKILYELKKENIPILGATLDGDNIYHTQLPENGIIIMGNESKGIKESLLPVLDKKLLIPNYPIGEKTSESLNVGVATAIICSEFRRRK